MRGMSRCRSRAVPIGVSLTLALLATAARATSDATAPPADAPLVKPAFDGNPGWLVIGETTSDAREAALKAGDRLAKQGIAVSPVRSDLFQGLRKGLFVLIYGSFADRARATALAAELTGKGIKVYVKNSGALAAKPGGRPRLLRIWGRLDETVRSPAPVEISLDPDSDNRTTETFYSDRAGWYQAWLLVDGATKRKSKLELCLGAAGYSAKAQCSDPPGSGGWFDVCGNADYGADQRDVYVQWSPTPDCNGE
jgi:hypothetical protein